MHSVFHMVTPTFASGLTYNNTSTATNSSSTSVDIWTDKHICDYLNNVTDTTITVICGIDLFLPPFIFVIGLFSNLIVVLVLRSSAFRSLSTSFYMIVNAVTDSTSILVALPAHYIYVNMPHVFDNARHFHAMCSFFNVFGWLTSDLGILFTVAMTTERAIAIKYPLKAYKLCTTRRAKFVVSGLTVFELVKISHLIFKSRVVSDTHSRLCDIDKTDAAYASFYRNVWPWLHVSILFVSYSVVVAGNVVICVNIRRSTQGIAIDGASRKSIRKDSPAGSKNRQISLMLLIDSFTLVVCTLPFSIVGILPSQTALIFDSPGGKNLAYTITFYLLYINRCLNFFLYCVSGSRFREALREIFFHSSNSSALNRSATRHDRSLSVSRRSQDDHVDHLDEAQSEKSENNSITPIALEVSVSTNLPDKMDRGTFQDNLSSPIFLIPLSGQSESSPKKMKVLPTGKSGSENGAFSTRL